MNRYISLIEWKEYVIKLMNQMSNIKYYLIFLLPYFLYWFIIKTICYTNYQRSIINHFAPKIDAWSANNHVNSLTEQQVLEIVRNNYESLTLKLEDDLDQYDRYSELPAEISYFSSLVTSLHFLNFKNNNISLKKFKTKRIISETRNNISDISKFDQVTFLTINWLTI